MVPIFKKSPFDLSRVNAEILHFQNWCNDNGMFINASKTKCMTIHFGNNLLPDVPCLENVDSLKILGVFLNNRLAGHNYFSYL